MYNIYCRESLEIQSKYNFFFSCLGVKGELCVMCDTTYRENSVLKLKKTHLLALCCPTKLDHNWKQTNTDWGEYLVKAKQNSLNLTNRIIFLKSNRVNFIITIEPIKNRLFRSVSKLTNFYDFF